MCYHWSQKLLNSHDKSSGPNLDTEVHSVSSRDKNSLKEVQKDQDSYYKSNNKLFTTTFKNNAFSNKNVKKNQRIPI